MRTINQTNFHERTNGLFKVVEMPNGTPDYISYTTWGAVSSTYYYLNNGVVRVSNHWGAVASCQWNLQGLNEQGYDKCRKTILTAGYISFEDLQKNENLQVKMWELRAEGKNNNAVLVQNEFFNNL
jgi:hypothetical protein